MGILFLIFQGAWESFYWKYYLETGIFQAFYKLGIAVDIFAVLCLFRNLIIKWKQSA